MDRGANYPSWTALSSGRVEPEQQSGDETEESAGLSDVEMCCQSTEARRGEGGREAQCGCF